MMKKIKVWCYLNIDNPFVAWEVAIGRIASLEALPCLQDQEKRWFLTQWQYSRLKNAFYSNPLNKIPLKNEYKIEHIRHHYYPDKVSRLRGSFFFKSKEDAINIVTCYGWKGFNPNHLSEVELYYNSDNDISFYDSTWFSMKAMDIMHEDDIKSYLENVTYWGEDSNPATEILAYGLGFVLNKALMQKAYNMIKARYPDAMCFLDSARFMLTASKTLVENGTPNWSLYEAGIACGLNRINTDGVNCDVIYIMRDESFKKYGLFQAGYPVKIRTPDFSDMSFSYQGGELNEITREYLYNL